MAAEQRVSDDTLLPVACTVGNFELCFRYTYFHAAAIKVNADKYGRVAPGKTWQEDRVSYKREGLRVNQRGMGNGPMQGPNPDYL